MGKKYSATTGGFYDPAIHSVIPADAVDVTDAEHRVLLEGQSAGKTIAPAGDGAPILIDPPPPTFEGLKEARRGAIRAAYDLAADEPVIALGTTWDGGFDSAIKLDAAKRLAESAGQADVTFYASDNQAHVLDFASALQVVIAVAGAFQVALATKQGLMRAIDDAQSVSDLSLVEWPQ